MKSFTREGFARLALDQQCHSDFLIFRGARTLRALGGRTVFHTRRKRC